MKRSSDGAKSRGQKDDALAKLVDENAMKLFKDAQQFLSADTRDRVSISLEDLKRAHAQGMTPRDLARAIEMRSMGRIAPKNVVARFRRLLKEAMKKSMKTKR